MVASLAYMARGTVGAVLLLSAGWKIRHPEEFRAAFRVFAPSTLRPFEMAATVFLAATEAACALMALLPHVAGQLGALAAALLLLTMSLFFARTPGLSGGCGCWRSPERVTPLYRKLVFARNSLLTLLAVTGLLAPGPRRPAQVAFTLVVSFLIGLMLLEITRIGGLEMTSQEDRIW
jgi:hypothetical protein